MATTITETSAAQLIINQLTREQYNNLGNDIVDNQLYIIDENILSTANEYFKNHVTQEEFEISAYADSDVVNKAYVTKVVSNINEVINTKQNNLTPGSYIAIENNTISVSDVTNASNEINESDTGLTTGKAVHDYVATQIGNVDQTFIKSVAGDYSEDTTAKVSVEATTTNKAVALKIHTNDIASAQALAAHIADANKHVSADERNKWNSALQGITSTDTKYIDIEDNNKVKPVIVDVTLENITADTTGIVPPSVIAALNAKVNDLQQIPQFSVVVAKSINVGNAEYVPSNSTEVVACVQNTVYLVPDTDAAAGTHIEYLCYKVGENLVIEQIGTTEIDLSGYATKTDEYETSSLTDTTTLITATVKSKVTEAVTGVSVDYSKLTDKLDDMVSATETAQDTANDAKTKAEANAAAIAQMIVFKKYN